MFLMLTEDPACVLVDKDGNEVALPQVLVNTEKIQRVEPRTRQPRTNVNEWVGCCEIYFSDDGCGLRVRETFEQVAKMLKPAKRRSRKEGE